MHRCQDFCPGLGDWLHRVVCSVVGFVCAQLAEAAGGAHTAWEDHTLVKFRHVVRVGYRKLGKEPAASEPGHGQKYCFESSRH